MKKLLLLLIIPFISFSQDLTYVPDDGFELLIENEVPNASNGDNNDNYVYTNALNSSLNPDWNGVLDISNELAPIFDLTGLEDFKLVDLDILNTFITTLNLTELEFIGEGGLYINNNILLQTILLPQDTIMHNNLHLDLALNDIVFNPYFCFSTFSILGNTDLNSPPLCQINFEGEIIEDTTSNSSYFAANISISWCSNISHLDFSGIINAPYQTRINYGDMFNSLQELNLNNPVSIYNWNLDISDYWNYELSCVELNSQSAVDFCNTTDWPDYNYSTNCYNGNVSCYNTDLIELPTTIKTPIKTIDILGRETNNKEGFQLHIYDNGTVDKKYLIK